MDRAAALERQPGDPAAVDEDALGLLEDPVDTRLFAERRGNPFAVPALVRLCPRRPDRRAAAAIEQLELDPGRVDRTPHQPAERIDLPDQVALCRAADGRVARHVRDRALRERAQTDALPKTRGGPRGLHAGMPGANHHDVELLQSHLQ